jgi:hypothetical protein
MEIEHAGANNDDDGIGLQLLEELEIQRPFDFRKDYFNLNTDCDSRLVLNRDPTITSICVKSNYFNNEDVTNEICWGAAGRSIGKSHYVKVLKLYLESFDHVGLLAFCRGMAVNRSIQRLDLELPGVVEPTDVATCESEIFFKEMRPFFEDNTNLVCVDIRYGENIWMTLSMKQAFCASKSLKELSIKSNRLRDRELSTMEEKLLCELFNHAPYLKISMTTRTIGKSSSLAIKSMLADPTCQLNSLSLTKYVLEDSTILNKDEKEIISNIGCGLNKNSSIEHLRYQGKLPQLLLSFTSMNTTLKKLELSHYGTEYRQTSHFYLLPVALKQCCALKCFSLHHYTIDHNTVNSIIGALFESSELEELNLQCRLNNESLGILSELMREKPLKSLHLPNKYRESFDFYGTTINGWTVFLDRLKEVGSSLASIDLSRRNLIGIHSTGNALKQFLDNNRKMTSLNLSGEDSPNGWISLLRVLHRTSITKLRGIRCPDDGDLPENFYQMIANGSLQEVWFDRFNSGVSRSIFSCLESPQTNLKSFRAHFHGCTIRDQQELMQTMSHWASALTNNATLRNLGVTFNLASECSPDEMWQVYSNVICNRHTINSTYCSNHTIETLELKFFANNGEQNGSDEDDDFDEEDGFDHTKWEMPYELYFLLQMNQSTNKVAVARRKIIWAHFSRLSGTHRLRDLNIIGSAMPKLLSWIGKESTELSMMYNFLLSTPSLFEEPLATPASPDRKRMRNELECIA